MNTAEIASTGPVENSDVKYECHIYAPKNKALSVDVLPWLAANEPELHSQIENFKDWSLFVDDN